MRERLFCQMATGAVCGILAAKYQGERFLLPAVFFFLAWLALCRRKQKTTYAGRGAQWLALTGALTLLTAAGAYIREDCLEQMRRGYEPFAIEGETVYLQGRLTGKEEKNQQWIYELSFCQMRQSLFAETRANPSAWTTPCGKVQVSMASDAYSIGEHLMIKGTVHLWDTARNAGNFDAKSFYHAKGIEFQIRDSEVLGSYGSPAKWREELYQWKIKWKKVYQELLPEKEGGALITMVLGDKSLLDGEIKDAYQTVGISHILAISGLHVSVIGMTVYRLLFRCGMGFFGAGICSSVLLLCYGEMVGFGASVFRAVMMFLLTAAAKAVGRSYDSLNALGFAAVCLLFYNPGILFYAGFQLSFGAVLGVVILGGIIKRDTQGHPWLENLLTCIAVEAAILPMTAWYYYEIPVYAAAVNLIVLPFVGILLVCGMAGGLLGLYVPGVAKFVLLPCRWILGAYEKICMITERLPHPVWVTGKPSGIKMVIYYGLLGLLAWLCTRCRKRSTGQASLRTWAGRSLAVGCLLVCLFLPPKAGVELDVLDVGQGDGIFLRTERGDAILIDGGSTDVSKVGIYRIEPFLKWRGIGTIDYWVVSHLDYDHISGLKELLETDYPVRHLLLSEEMERDEVFEELKALAESKGTELLFIKQGEVLFLGDASFKALSPGEETDKEKNARSLSLLYEENGFTALFTGDIGEKEERQILNQGWIGEVDFYKAAHHGSNTSNSMELLARIKPLVTAVSCGRNNRYGHPGKDAVEHMQKSGSFLFYTMETGQLCLRRNGEILFAEPYLEPEKRYGFYIRETGRKK